MVEIFSVKLLSTLLLPPAINLVLLAIAWPFRRRLPRLAAGCVFIALGSLYVLSTPMGAYGLSRGLQHSPTLASGLGQEGVGAIVVLGGGRYRNAPEYGEDTVSKRALVRLRYGARLHRQSGLPLLVSGGNVYEQRLPEAELMARVLVEDFGVPVRWRESGSRNTWENAQLSAPLLLAAGINRVLLVTHASHTPRSLDAFRRNGIDAIAAPTGFFSRPSSSRGVLNWVPRAGALHASSSALHEYLGLLWYQLRY